MKGGRHDRVLTDGIHRVSPVLALTHLVTTREIAFDVPVNEVRSSDGIAVKVDLLLSLAVSDPARMAYSITIGRPRPDRPRRDAGRGPHTDPRRRGPRRARSRRGRGRPAARADRREALARTASRRGTAAFTRVVLPEPLMASVEARRLAAVQLDRGGAELRPRPAADLRPREPHRPGGRGATHHGRARGDRRGDPAPEAPGADRGQPGRRPVRPRHTAASTWRAPWPATRVRSSRSGAATWSRTCSPPVRRRAMSPWLRAATPPRLRPRQSRPQSPQRRAAGAQGRRVADAGAERSRGPHSNGPHAALDPADGPPPRAALCSSGHDPHRSALRHRHPPHRRHAPRDGGGGAR